MKPRRARTRVRRTAADARETILEVADRQLRDHGPAALRLHDVAEAAGMSHPTVLHHFGSREGLVAAVVERAAVALQHDLATALAGAGPDGEAMMERVADMFATRGHARLIAWLLLSGYDPIDAPALQQGWQAIAGRIHALRAAGKPRSASLEDTHFVLLLSWLALFGQAIAGPAMFETAGLGSDPATAQRFRAWLAKVIEQHVRPERTR